MTTTVNKSSLNSHFHTRRTGAYLGIDKVQEPARSQLEMGWAYIRPHRQWLEAESCFYAALSTTQSDAVQAQALAHLGLAEVQIQYFLSGLRRSVPENLRVTGDLLKQADLITALRFLSARTKLVPEASPIVVGTYHSAVGYDSWLQGLELQSDAYCAYAWAGDIQQSLQLLEAAAVEFHVCEDDYGLASTRISMAAVLAASGLYEKAFAECAQGEEILRHLASRTGHAEARRFLSILAIAIVQKCAPNAGLLPGCSSGDSGRALIATVKDIAERTRIATPVWLSYWML